MDEALSLFPMLFELSEIPCNFAIVLGLERRQPFPLAVEERRNLCVALLRSLPKPFFTLCLGLDGSLLPRLLCARELLLNLVERLIGSLALTCELARRLASYFRKLGIGA